MSGSSEDRALVEEAWQCEEEAFSVAVNIEIVSGKLPAPGAPRGSFGEGFREHARLLHAEYNTAGTRRCVGLLEAADSLHWRLVHSHIDLVEKHARRWHRQDDMYQEGLLAFFRAALRWNPAASAFRTYGRYWIISGMNRHASQTGLDVFRTSEKIVQAALRVEKEHHDRVGAGEFVTLAQVADELGAPAGTVEYLYQAQVTQRAEEGFVDPVYNLPDFGALRDVERSAEKAERKAAVLCALDDLEATTRAVLQMRIGLGPYKRAYTTKEIGKALDISASRVTPILEAGVEALKEHPLLQQVFMELGE